MSVPFMPKVKHPSVWCPRYGAETSVNTCANCENRGMISFLLQQVECFYPASTSPKPDLPDIPVQDENGILILPVKGVPPTIPCPRGSTDCVTVIQSCYRCWHLVSVTWTQVKCAFPEKGADFGGTKPSAT